MVEEDCIPWQVQRLDVDEGDIEVIEENSKELTKEELEDLQTLQHTEV